MKTLFKITWVALAMLCFITTNAQEFQLRPGSVVANHSSPNANVLISPPTSAGVNTVRQLQVDGGSVNYGNTTGVMAYGKADGSAKGNTIGYLSLNSAWAASGTLAGVVGFVDSVTQIQNSSKAGGAYGGSFGATIDNPITSDSGNEINLVGSRSILDGNITTYPMNGVVAATYAQDKIQGTGTWAAFFDGRGHFSQNVGINTTNPLSRLSVNGDGNALYGGYITSPSSGHGSRGLHVEMPSNIGFADHNYGITSVIESGYGYTTGLYGIASTTSPSANGRAYGVSGLAGNANINFGLYGRIHGQNRGTALFAVDNVKHAAYNELFNGTWAAYMVGDAHISDRVAIGTATMPNNLNGYSLADYKLYVCGGVLAKELLIPNATWCDYVFEDTYQLTPLEDVKTHIEEKGYLHNTPSAKTVEKEGLKLGKMTVNQQEKIEEIFLHLIQLNDDMKQLKAENAKLKTALAASK